MVNLTQPSGCNACWVGSLSFNVCCNQYSGRKDCFDLDHSYFICCLTRDGFSMDLLSLAFALSLVPPVSTEGSDRNCDGWEPWDELALTLQSMVDLRFSEKFSPGRHVWGLASSIFTNPFLGVTDCPLGVLAISIALMIMHRGLEQVYDALSRAVRHLIKQFGDDIIMLGSSRWPIFSQLSNLEPGIAGFSWSPELASLRFMSIPKTGGTSIENFGGRHGYSVWAVVPVCSIRHCSADWWDQDPEITFCSVRNPYDRVLSAALWRGADTVAELNNWIYENVGHAWERRDVEDNIVLPAHGFVYSSDGKRKCMHILHTEDLSSEFCQFLRTRSQAIQVQYCIAEMQGLPTNVNLKQRFSLSDFSDSSISLINSVFEDDFRIFGYKAVNSSEALAGLGRPRRPRADRGWFLEAGIRVHRYHGSDALF